MSLPSRTSLRRGEACRLGGSGAMAQSCAITLKTTTKSIPQVRREKRVHLRLGVLGFVVRLNHLLRGKVPRSASSPNGIAGGFFKPDELDILNDQS
jgi:hypothetical protein